MATTIVCPSCQRKLSIKDGAGSRKVKCPRCGHSFVTPAPGVTPTLVQQLSPSGGTTTTPTAAPPPEQSRSVAPPTISQQRQPSEPSVDGPDGRLIGEKYQIRAELGRGAFGVVYRAYDPKMEREVAVKMLKSDSLDSEDAIRRFEYEAVVLAKIVHSNVVPVFDKGKDGTSHYLVSALIPGKPLNSLIPPGGMVDPRGG